MDFEDNILRAMDELFPVPLTPIAFLRAYWLIDSLYASFAVIRSSEAAFTDIKKQIAI